MKKFKKDENGFLICEVCNKSCNGIVGLSVHIFKKHKNEISKEEYYIKYLKEEKEGICKCSDCHNKTEFTGYKKFYKNCCSKECRNKYRQERIEEENLKNHGVKNIYQTEKCKKKIKDTKKEKYENEKFVNVEKRKNTLKEKIKEDPEYRNKINKKVRETKIKNGNYKNKKQFYTVQCEECKKFFKNLIGLNNHVVYSHNPEEYYIKFLKKENEGICKNINCNNKTKFISIYKGYKNCCCKKCIIKYTYQKTKLYYINNFGVENCFQLDHVKEKIKQTNLKIYGSENVFGSNIIKNKIGDTFLKIYGVRWPMQSKEIFLKAK